MKLGDTVIYTVEGKSLRGEEVLNHPIFPAIVYKVHTKDILGIYVFTDNGLEMMRSVNRGERNKPKTWHSQVGF